MFALLARARKTNHYRWTRFLSYREFLFWSKFVNKIVVLSWWTNHGSNFKSGPTIKLTPLDQLWYKSVDKKQEFASTLIHHWSVLSWTKSWTSVGSKAPILSGLIPIIHFCSFLDIALQFVSTETTIVNQTKERKKESCLQKPRMIEKMIFVTRKKLVFLRVTTLHDRRLDFRAKWRKSYSSAWP